MALAPGNGNGRPDPSTLTTAQLQREIESLKQLIEARLDGMDRAGVILADNVNRVPTLLDRSIEQLKELIDERFNSTQRQFGERDVRTDQAAVATKIAVDAALQAQKEAVNAQNISNATAIAKSEIATEKRIDALMELRQSDTKATDEKIADIKGRLDRGEGVILGGGITRTERRLEMGSTLGVVVTTATVVSVVVGALAFLAAHH